MFNLLIPQYLDYAELQVIEQKPMTMLQWIDKLDNLIISLLNDAGTISHLQAVEKREFEEYRRKECCNNENDFDRAIKELTEQSKNGHEDEE